jgi:hypothetical protein
MAVDIKNTRMMHSIAELHTNPEGEYYVVVMEHSSVPTPIRQTYQPFGYRMQFPKKWGRKRGALSLLDFKIEDQERIINNARLELEKLRQCKEKTLEWKET